MDALVKEAKGSIPLHVVALSQWDAFLNTQDAAAKQWVKTSGFKAKHGAWIRVPSTAESTSVFAVLDDAQSDAFWMFGAWARQLPAHSYVPESHGLDLAMNLAALAWGMGAYRFEKYKEKPSTEYATLCVGDQVDMDDCSAWLKSIGWVRDLVNMPTNDCHPEALGKAVQQLADAYGGDLKAYVGDELIEPFPAVHAVGRAGEYAPRLMHCTFGDPKHPKLTLVGKGVCFDTGGLNIKVGNSMYGMKKDMGGAANVLGLADYLLSKRLPMHVTVILPIVENNVSSNSYRPGDIVKSRSGLHIEIKNTDAEGRVILSDALTLACEGKPDLLIDFATLTGAARVALGFEVPAFYTDDERIASLLQQAGKDVHDWLWPMPLYKPYAKLIRSNVADISNASDSPWGGSITAALFLQRFVDKQVPWVHFDISAANLKTSPGHPEGGEAMAIRACAKAIEDWLAS